MNNDDAKPFEKKIRISDAEIDDMTTGFTLLRNPLVIGNEWPNVVTVDGKQYQGTTRITHLEGSWVFTETHVPGMDGFGEHTLHRKMVFGVGQGHIYDLEFYMFSELFWADFWISELWEEREYLMGEWWDR